MKTILPKIGLFVLLITNLFVGQSLFAAPEINGNGVFQENRYVDKGTFNEYRLLILRVFIDISNYYDANGKIPLDKLLKLSQKVKESYYFLPETLKNESLRKRLISKIQSAQKDPSSDTAREDLIDALKGYIETEFEIESVAGEILASPITGNAPLNVTLEGDAIDGNGTLIDNGNYIWWIKVGGKRKVIGVGKSINYTFNHKDTYTVFLDVVSSSKNSFQNTDVLPYRGKIKINVGSRLANISINVNGEKLNEKAKLKFTPDQAMYGLIFDASGSLPAKSTEFLRTAWDFGNGLKKAYDGRPKPERVVYTREGVYPVVFQIKTNKGDLITRTFDIEVRDPIATIKVDREEGFIGDKFNFTAKTSGDPDKLIYGWKIIDISTGKSIGEKKGKVFSFNFEKMGSYSVILDVKTTYSNESNIDVQYININSRKPEPNFTPKISNKSKPNTIELNATKTFDPDYVDNLDLKYTWYIDGEKVNLIDVNINNSFGYYKFDSIGTKTITLKVEDSSGEIGELTKTIDIKSLLSVNFEANPRAIKRGENISFRALSPKAKTFKWDFGDGKKYEGKDKIVNHKYEKSKTYKVKLEVGDDIGVNSFSKEVFVGDGRFPLAILDVSVDGGSIPELQKNLCNGNEGYIFNRQDKIKFDLSNSIDVNGESNNLKYTFKIEGNYDTKSSSKTYQFSEEGCYEVIASVKSSIKGTTDKDKVWIKIVNAKPSLGRVGINVISEDDENIILEASAMGANDPDGAVLSYLWYYYTSTDSTEQSIRKTYTEKTKFALPKIRGDYHFVVVLTDNDGAVYSSDKAENKNGEYEIIGENNNANVPIINLKADKTNFYLGEEVVITAKVDNVLGKSLTDKIEKYYWDFDGDGFYDEETKENTINYKFKKVGTFYSKIKVKYRGYTSTKNITMTVSNKLNADFSYISIGNKFILINRSTGNYDNLSWDLGDGNKVSNKNVFIHNYNAGKQSHLVTLSLSGGGEIKKKAKKVSKNIINLRESKKPGIHAFTSPSLEKDGKTLILNDKTDVFVYFGTLEPSVDKYSVDLDINYDSDIEGTKSDDEDILVESIKPIKIDLNESKNQVIRLGYKDSYGLLLDTFDIKIIKNYINEEEVEHEVTYEGISDIDKKIIEDLKSSVSNYPNEEKVKSTEYIARLQEEWRDEFERTKLIYEFTGYLEGLNIDTTETHDILISIFAGEDSDEINTWYNALVGIIPNEITCADKYDSEFSDCRSYMVYQIGKIKNVKSLEDANTIGGELLDIIKTVDKTILSNKNKLDFKAALSEYISLITGEINDYEPPKQEQVTNEEGSSIFTILIYIVGGILVIFVVGGIGFFIYFKLVNKDGSKKLEDFILDKTKNKSDNDDILASFGEEEVKKEENKTNLSKNLKDSFESNKTITKKENISNKTEVAKNKVESIKKLEKKKNIPNWLAGTGGFADDLESENLGEIKKSNSFLNNDKDSIDKTKNINNIDKNTKVTKNNNIKPDNNNDSKKSDIKTIDDSKAPDWLKGSFDKVVNKEQTTDKNMDYKKKNNDKKIDNKKENNNKINKTENKSKNLTKSNDNKTENIDKKEVNKEEKKSTIAPTTKNNIEKEQGLKNIVSNKKEEIQAGSDKDNTKIPDWLKGSFTDDNDKKEEKDKTDTKKEDKVPDWLKSDIKDVKMNKKILKEEKSLDTKPKESSIKKEDKKSIKEVGNKKIDNNDDINNKNIDKSKEKKDIVIKNEIIGNKDDKNTIKMDKVKKNIAKDSSKKVVDKSTLLNDSDNTSDDELWDNGMDVPDWLKTDDK